MLVDFIRRKKKYKSAAHYNKDSKVFCAMPFVHSHVAQGGNVTPCCQAPWEGKASLGEINKASVQEIWNGKKFNKFRSAMIAEKPHSSCERCYEKEALGWISLREITNAKYETFIQTLAENNFEPSLYAKPVYWDIRFSNVCNLKCRICSLASSSSWYEDELALGKIEKGTSVLTSAILDEEKFYHEFDACIDEIKEVYFAGGEPLMMQQHYTILDFLIKKGKTNCKLYYNTNLSRLALKQQSVLEY